jgi:hypothetical protein
LTSPHSSSVLPNGKKAGYPARGLAYFWRSHNEGGTGDGDVSQIGNIFDRPFSKREQKSVTLIGAVSAWIKRDDIDAYPGDLPLADKEVDGLGFPTPIAS